MREQGGAATLLCPLIERKKASLKVSGRVESADSRRPLGDGYVSYLNGKSIANMPGSRLKGGSSNSENHKRESGLPEQFSLEKTKESLESEPQKPKSLEDGLFPQWGYRKRSRCSRLEQSNHAADETAVPVKKALRLEGGAEKKSSGRLSQENGTAKLQGQGVQAPGVVKRNGSIPSRGACSPSRRLVERAAEERRGASSFLPHGVALACRQSFPEERSTRALPASSEASLPCALVGPARLLAQVPPENNKRLEVASLEWPRILITLSRKEKEEDFLILKGTKLPQRPKRRPKAVEKALHFCTPGNWLSDLARGRYDVREKKSMKKKPRGLKAMESAESDSD